MTVMAAACAGCPVPAQGIDRVGPVVAPFCVCEACRDPRNDWAALAQRDRVTPCQADMIAIGTAPGEEEVRMGEPLVGPSGRQLRAALQWAGFSGTLAKLNVCNCRTVKQGKTKLVNRDPTAAELRECLNRVVWPLLRGYKGTVLVLGAVAYRALTDERFGSFSMARGHRLDIQPINPPEAGVVRQARVKAAPCRRCACGEPLAPRRRKCDGCKRKGGSPCRVG